jgi:fructoselysine-6-P-deglycase FrlB-like protein
MEEMVAAEGGLAGPILAHPSAALVAAAAAEALAAGQGVVVVGCGTSEHAARAIAALLSEAAGPRAAVAVEAFDAALAPPADGLLIAVSHQGETAATTAALEAARGAGATTCLITAAGSGAAHRAADLVYPTPLADASWCHTVGYLSPLLAGAAIAVALGREQLSAAAVSAHLAACDAALAALPARLGPLERVHRLLVVGSGVDAITAAEQALKLEEGAWIPTTSLHVETLLHGHLPAADADTGVVAYVLDPRAHAARAARTHQALAAARAVGAATLLLATGDGAVAAPGGAGGESLLLPDGGALGLLGALVAGAVALQRTTLALAAVRGTNPDLLRRDDPRYREAARLAGSAVAADPA